MRIRDSNTVSEILWGISVLTLALLVCTYRLSDIPSVVAPDGLDTLITYLQWQVHGLNSIYRVNWNGSSFTNTLIFGGSFELFSGTLFGLRFPAAIGAVGAVCLAYLSLRVLGVNRIIAGPLTVALATNPVLLNFAREAWENIFTAIPVLLETLGLVLVSKSGRLRSIGVGLLTLAPALGLYAYHPGKVLWAFGLLAPLIFLREHLGRRELGLILLGGALCSVIALVGMLSSSHQAFHRISVVSIFSASSPLHEFVRNLEASSRAFFFLSPAVVWERYAPHEQPLASQLFLPFFLVGLMRLYKLNRAILALLLILFFVPQLFSVGALDIARAVHVLPLVYVCIGVGLSVVLLGLMRALSIQQTKAYPFTSQLLLFGLLVGHCLPVFVVYRDMQLYGAWVESPGSKDARQPAVLGEEFPIWYDEVSASIRARGVGFDGAGWQKIRIRRQLTDRNVSAGNLHHSNLHRSNLYCGTE